MSNQKAVSTARSARTLPRGCIVVFGVPFVLAGATVFIIFAVMPTINFFRAKTWSESTATITRSEIETRNSDDGASYHADIHFTYEFAGKELTSEEWQVGLSFGSHATARSVVNRYPVGSKHPCFVDPQPPHAAVLDRTYSWTNLTGLFGLIFVAAGCGVIWTGLRNKPPNLLAERESHARLLMQGTAVNPARSAATGDSAPLPWEGFEGPQRLKATEHRLTVFLIVLVFALFWNAITWVIFLNALQDGWIFIILFLAIFIAAGAGLILAAVYMFLKMFNPVVSIALSNGAASPGEEIDIAWETSGRTGVLSELRIAIVAEEVATYVRGTSTNTDHKEFIRIPVAAVAREDEMRFGSHAVRVPEDAIHSFEAPNNKIVWSVEVHGPIRFWPDVREKFRFFVRNAGPKPAPSISGAEDAA
jgi:Protein of unknown function (DUF3592)